MKKASNEKIRKCLLEDVRVFNRWVSIFKQHADLRFADLNGADLREANLRFADLRDTDLDFACLPLWCGGQFKADEKICKQIIAHALRIMELSGEGSEELRGLMCEYKTGWHREREF